MNSTKNLLSVTRLKKYFPVAGVGRKKTFVHAVDEVSFEVKEGETLGLVGESGCGKSTLGRVVLQLIDKTAGGTYYYGRTVDELTPRYIFKTLQGVKRQIKRLNKKQNKAKKYAKNSGDFYDMQRQVLSQALAQTAEKELASVVGGFLVKDTDEGCALLLKRFRLLALKNVKEGELERVETALSSLREKHANDPEFRRLESLREEGVNLSRLTGKEMRFLRRDIQIVFQDPYSSLNPRMTVGQILSEGVTTHRFFKKGSKELKEYISSLLSACGLQEYMLPRYPHQFSGGQRQRVCIARALSVKPRFVVCDECVSALDVSVQSQIINLLKDLQEREKFTCLFISHDLSVVRYVSDRIGVMYLGKIVELCECETLFNAPRHPYTMLLLSSVPSARKQTPVPIGQLPSPVKPPSGCPFHTRCPIATERCKTDAPDLLEVEKGHFVACHYPYPKGEE